MRTIVAVVVSLWLTAPAAAQGVDGYVSLMVDTLPVLRPVGEETRATSELRARVLLERRVDVSDRVRLTASGYADGLLADRGRGARATAAIVRPQELHVEASWARADLRVGLSRVVWGRLDEFLPTDVVNPQDLARFFLEGRVEGRLPVAMVRGRWLPSDRFSLEGLYVPIFRRGTFDQLDEETSPFNIARTAGVAVTRREPPRTLANAQGGARASVTSGRVDWSLSVYRGFEPLPLFDLETRLPPLDPLQPAVVERYPRFTMIGGDFETVRGPWGLRGEVAAFVDRTLQAVDVPRTARGRAVEAGLGADRRAGAVRVSGNLVVARRWAGEAAIDRTDVSLVAAVDRTFARETRSLRLFGVYNPNEQSGFARVIAAISLRDDVSLEASGGLFAGDGRDALSLLASRDFLYLRLKVFY